MINKKRGMVIMIFSVAVILAISVISVDASFWGKITGWAQKDAPAKVTIDNSPPVILEVHVPNSPSLTEDTEAPVSFSFIAYDVNGVDDLKDNSIIVNFSNSDNTPNAYDTTRFGSCSKVGDLDGNDYLRPGEKVRNYSCTISMKYYDEPAPGQWLIGIRINDSKDAFDESLEYTFALNTLTGFKITTDSNPPGSINWNSALVANQENQIADDNMIIYNTGNTGFGGLNPKLKFIGANLHGNSITEQFISVGNFTVDTGQTPCLTENRLINATSIDSNAVVTYGDNTISGDAEDDIYFCLKKVPAGLSAQDYATISGDPSFPWVVTN